MSFPVQRSWSGSRSHQLRRSCLQAGTCCRRGRALRTDSEECVMALSESCDQRTGSTDRPRLSNDPNRLFCWAASSIACPQNGLQVASGVFFIYLFIFFCQISSSSLLPGRRPRSVPSHVNPPELSFLCLFVFSPTGNFKGMCKQIDHFPEETDYEADPSEYFLREYLASPFSCREILRTC